MLTINIGVQVKFDGNGFLEVEIPKAYYEKVRKTPGSLRRGVSLQGGGRLSLKGDADKKCPLPSLALKIPGSPLPTQTCGMCGNFNGEEEDELLMPNDELALDDVMYVDSWQDKEIDPK